MVKTRDWGRLINCLLTIGMIGLSLGCKGWLPVPTDEEGIPRLIPNNWETRTPFQPLDKTATMTVIPTPIPPPQTILWVDESVPPGLRDGITFSGEARFGETIDESNMALVAMRGSLPTMGETLWVYALVAPFPTVTDGVSLDEIKRTWRGEGNASFSGAPLMMTQDTKAAFANIWGEPADQGVKILSQAEFLDKAWAERPAWAITPMETLEPRWKVLRVDGVSPIDQVFDPGDYKLTVHFQLIGQGGVFEGNNNITLPATNRDAEKMTSLILTGVTALVRATADKMERHGMTYPGLDIQDWLRNADLTHISNEVSFDPGCPNPNPFQSDTIFCSKPQYLELLEFVGADIIELTGNHVLDWGRPVFEYTLGLYRDRNMMYYAGGMNLEEARRPLLIEHNGNKLAFLGCNLPGPPFVWATSTLSGVAGCEDYEWMKREIRQLSSEGYLVVVTLQHIEYYSFIITPKMRDDFHALSDAGAVIVSGSQAHYPHPFAFEDGKFIHFGLGNLFFDQMDSPELPGIQREFIDRHIFLNGRHISTEVLTAHLEDYSRPRPMTAEERANFLSEAFAASGW